MRVLIVTTSFPGARAPHNGVFIREHARALVHRGHEVAVLAPRVFSSDPEHSEIDGVAVHRFDYLSGERLLSEHSGFSYRLAISYFFAGVRACRRLIRRFRPHVIHAHWAIPSGTIAAVATSVDGKRPLIVTAHGADVRLASSGSSLLKYLFRRTLEASSAVIAVSRVQKRQLGRLARAAVPRIEVVPMGVDTKAFGPADRDAARARLGLEPELRVALFVGALTRMKGVLELIEAARLVLPDDERVRIYLLGTGPLEKQLRDITRGSAYRDRVRVVGAVDHNAIPVWMNAADVVVLPSHAEGLPVCLMEAAAVGTPVIATAVGGCEEIVSLDPRSMLIQPGDVDELARALSIVLSRPSDTERRSVLPAGSVYTMDGSLDRICALYERLARTSS